MCVRMRLFACGRVGVGWCVCLCLSIRLWEESPLLMCSSAFFTLENNLLEWLYADQAKMHNSNPQSSVVITVIDYTEPMVQF